MLPKAELDAAGSQETFPIMKRRLRIDLPKFLGFLVNTFVPRVEGTKVFCIKLNIAYN